MFRRLLDIPTPVKAAAFAGGVALSAYMLNNAAVKAAEPEASIYVINGFYMAMREKYTTPGTSIYYYLVEWDPAKLSWEDFRGKVLGATDPVTADDGALRKAIYKDWKALGLAGEPNVGDNGVHASASPFEAMAERLNWLGVSLEADDFGKAMLDAGIPKDTIMSWTKDPQVPFEGKKGWLSAEVIEKNKLIDNHYYAIANKASLTKPAELNPPAAKQEDFEKKFGVSWKAALAKGIVFNAVDGCARL